MTQLASALDEVSASSAGGMPFLVCYGITFLVVGISSYFVPRETSALVAMFQGVVALPVALFLERRIRWGKMAVNNPLRKLSVVLAVSQGLAIPFLIVVYNIEPGQIPICLAGLAGVHLLPYGWLQRTSIYIGLAIFVSVGSFLIVVVFKTAAYELILLLIGIAYLAVAPFVYQHSRAITAQG